MAIARAGCTAYDFPITIRSMQLKFKLSMGVRPQAALALLFCALLSSPLAASERYLSPGHPDGITLLPPPPAVGSEEEAADLASVRAVVHGRTKAEEARAFADSGLAFAIFEPAIGSEFSMEKLPKTEIRAAIAETGAQPPADRTEAPVGSVAH